jgi:hypothetical protein
MVEQLGGRLNVADAAGGNRAHVHSNSKIRPTGETTRDDR